MRLIVITPGCLATWRKRSCLSSGNRIVSGNAGSRRYRQPDQSGCRSLPGIRGHKLRFPRNFRGGEMQGVIRADEYGGHLRKTSVQNAPKLPIKLRRLWNDAHPTRLNVLEQPLKTKVGSARRQHALGLASAECGPHLMLSDEGSNDLRGIGCASQILRRIRFGQIELQDSGCVPETHQKRSSRRSSMISCNGAPALPVLVRARSSASSANHCLRSSSDGTSTDRCAGKRLCNHSSNDHWSCCGRFATADSISPSVLMQRNCLPANTSSSHHRFPNPTPPCLQNSIAP